MPLAHIWCKTCSAYAPSRVIPIPHAQDDFSEDSWDGEVRYKWDDSFQQGWYPKEGTRFFRRGRQCQNCEERSVTLEVDERVVNELHRRREQLRELESKLEDLQQWVATLKVPAQSPKDVSE